MTRALVLPLVALAALGAATGGRAFASEPSAAPPAPGAKIAVRRVVVSGVDEATARALEAQLGAGAVRSADPSALAAGVDRVLAYEEAHGHPYAIVRPDVLLEEGACDVVLRVEEGPLVTLGPLAIAGNGATRRATIERLAGHRPGVPYDPACATQIVRRLDASRLFARVAARAPLDSAHAGIVPVTVEVAEPRYNSFQGAAAYLGRGRGLAGVVDLALGNIGGRGAGGRARWQRQGSVSQFALAYREPWIGPLPIGASISLDHLIQDSLYTRTQLALAATLAVGRRWTASMGVERVRGVTTSGAGGSSEATAGTLSLAFDTDPAHHLTRRGVHAAADASLGSRAEKGTAALSHARALAGGSIEARLAAGRSRLVVARVAGRALLAEPEATPSYDLLFAGGAQSLRGYREHQFSGTRVATATLEGRLLFDDEGSRLTAFVDAGWISDATREGRPLDRPLGYGLGLWSATRAGLLGVEYGVGRGASLADGQVHVTLTRGF